MEIENEAVVPVEEVVAEVPAEEVTADEPEEESIESIKAKLAKAEEIAENQRIRAEKAEKKAKTVTPSAAVEKDGLSSSDMLAVLKADIHEDDMDRLHRFAKSEGLSIKDAIKNPEMKAILELRTEQRATAAAANVSNVRRGSSKLTDEALVANASAGNLPDTDAEIARLIAAKARLK